MIPLYLPIPVYLMEKARHFCRPPSNPDIHNKVITPSTTCHSTALPTSIRLPDGKDIIQKVVHTLKYESYTNTLEDVQTVSPPEMETDMLIQSSLYEDFPCTYDRSPGSMQNSMIWMMKRLHKGMGGCVYYVYIVSDDDTSMRKYLPHPETRPTGKKNIGGYLPKEISVPEWVSDPTHRAKCVAGSFFELVNNFKSMKKLYALRLNIITHTTPR